MNTVTPAATSRYSVDRPDIESARSANRSRMPGSPAVPKNRAIIDQP
jgi:hypothetical protein